MTYSKNNIIRGLFRRYGLFRLNMPLIADVKEENWDCLQLHNSFDNSPKFFIAANGSYLCSELPPPEFDDPSYSDWQDNSLIWFYVSDEDAEVCSKCIKIILPIIEDDDDLTRINEYIKESVPHTEYMTFLVYSMEDGGFVVISYESRRQKFSKVVYKKEFDYKIKCLGEFEWRKR